MDDRSCRAPHVAVDLATRGEVPGACRRITVGHLAHATGPQSFVSLSNEFDVGHIHRDAEIAYHNVLISCDADELMEVPLISQHVHDS